MSERIGVCSGCGARFKIPESFKGSSAPCKKCDGVIKISAAGATPAAAPAAPAASKPAAAPAARPAAASSARPSAHRTEAARPAPAARAEKHGASRRPARDAGGSARRGRDTDGAKKGNPMLLVGGIAGVLIVGGIVVGVMMKGGKEQPASTDTANAATGNGAAAQDAGSGAAGTAAPTAGSATGDAGSMAAKSAPASSNAADADTDKRTPAPEATTPEAGTPAVADPPTKPADAPSPDTDIDAEVHSKFEFTALDKAPGTTDDEWKEISEAAAKLADSGKPRKRAMDKLVPFGMKAVPACINFLNGLDLTDSNAWVTGYEIATFIQDRLTSGTILIPYHGDFSTDTKEINRNHKVLTSIVSYWNAQTSDNLRWEALMAKYEEKKGSAGKSTDDSSGE